MQHTGGGLTPVLLLPQISLAYFPVSLLAIFLYFSDKKRRLVASFTLPSPVNRLVFFSFAPLALGRRVNGRFFIYTKSRQKCK
jgi:hypothetical protein